jgi:hypothetical protein
MFGRRVGHFDLFWRSPTVADAESRRQASTLGNQSMGSWGANGASVSPNCSILTTGIEGSLAARFH